jgi:hypothetical protein
MLLIDVGMTRADTTIQEELALTSFFCTFSNFEKIIIIGTINKPKKCLERGMEGENTSKGVQAKLEAHNVSNSTPTRSPGPGRHKNDAKVAYRVQIQCSTYVWKDKEIRFPMPLVPRHYQVRVNGNCQNNWTSRIYQGAAPSFLGRWPVYHIGAHQRCVQGFCTPLSTLYSVESPK